MRKSIFLSSWLFISLSLSPFILPAQTSIKSPYSRYGLGELYAGNSQFSMAMGGINAGLRNQWFINPQNPASYTVFDSVSFLFDGGLYSKMSTFRTDTLSQPSNYASIGYITMGFPVTRWWRTSFGLLPFSSVGYTINNDQTVEGFGNTRFEFKGNGGLSQMYFGNGFKLFGGLSAGINYSFIFGSINKTRNITFPDSANVFNARISEMTKIRGFYADFGLQYNHTYSNGRFFTLGATYAPGQSLNGKSDKLAVSYQHDYSTDLDEIRDTVEYTEGAKGTIQLPQAVGGGFSFGNGDRWMAGADVKWQEWSNFTYLGKSDSLKNSLILNAGGQFRPSTSDISQYWKRITYRAGVRFNQTYLFLNDTRINEFGISFGFGLPMKKTRSTLNIAFEAGGRGTTQNNLIRENYFRFTLGASIFDRWFLKRKYD
ncbi:MAG TPA: hypothetical protein PK796_06685 [Bacteroidales bacterium]|nr:hypothetical protein [Bacteroidales bacterium]